MAEAALVGRHWEVEQIREALAAAVGGSGQMLFVTGDAGIGKSRLAAEAAALAGALGAEVHWGDCWEGGGAPPFWPWTQVIRSLSSRLDDATLAARLGPAAGVIAAAVPQLADRLPPAGEQVAEEPEQLRFEVFHAIASLLEASARSSPVVIILEDLHAADIPSVMLLGFLAPRLSRSRILVLATFRPAEVDASTELSAAIARAGRAALKIPVGGLNADDVGTLVKAATGCAPAIDLIASLHELTEGNPLYAIEVAVLLASSGQLAGRQGDRLPVPAGVRAVLRSRLQELSPVARDVVAVAAVAGKEFPASVIAAATGLESDALLAALGEAEIAGILVRTRPAVFSFRHALIREAQYEDLPASSRAWLHLAVGEAIERLEGTDLAPHAAVLAHHFLQAEPLVDAERARRYAALAARTAFDSMAYEAAAQHAEAALQIGRCPPDDEVDLLLLRAESLAAAGDLRRTWKVFEDALERSREAGLRGKFAMAALGLGRYFGGTAAGAASSDRVLSALEEAVATADDPVLRTRLLARLANELRWDRLRQGEAEALADAALQAARHIGDAALIAYALIAGIHARHWTNTTADNDAALTELGALAPDLPPSLQAQVCSYDIVSALTGGERGRAGRGLRQLEGLAARHRRPAIAWRAAVMRAMVSMLDQPVDEAQAVVDEALSVGQRGVGIAQHAWAAQKCQILRRRWTPEANRELAQLLEGLSAEFPAVSTYSAGLAWALCELGEREKAAGELGRVMAALDDQLRDHNLEVTLIAAAHVANLLGDAGVASRLLAKLEPRSGRNAIVGGFLDVFAPIDRAIALCHSTLGDRDRAAAAFESALALDRRTGNKASLVLTLVEASRFLSSGSADEVAHGAALATEAAALARWLGMDGWLAKLEPPEQKQAVEGITVVHAGDVWTVSYGDRSVQVKSSKGLEYLAELVARRGQEIHVLDLVAGRVAAVEHTGGDVANEDTGPVLDPQAKAEYRRRIVVLRSEIDDALAAGNAGAAERAQDELDFLTAELARAVGMGGRDRRSGSLSERARVNATRALRSAVARVTELDAVLGDHLDRSLRTGTFCAYDPA